MNQEQRTFSRLLNYQQTRSSFVLNWCSSAWRLQIGQPESVLELLGFVLLQRVGSRSLSEKNRRSFI